LNPFALQPLAGPLPRLSALAKAIFLICLSLAAMRFDLLPLSLLFILILALGGLMGLRLQDGVAAGRGLVILAAFSALARLVPGTEIFRVESLGASTFMPEPGNGLRPRPAILRTQGVELGTF